MNLSTVRKPAGLFVLFASVLAGSAFGQDAPPPAAAAPEAKAPEAAAKTVHVVLSTNFGDIVLELDAEKAPVSVANFLNYVDKGFYNTTLFHRVMPNFMIQGGGYGAGLIEKSGTDAAIKNEWQNGLKNVRGAIAMARTRLPDSATAQFFINTVDNPRLDATDEATKQSLGGAGYAVFGKVIGGMGVVDAIKGVPTKNEPSIGFQPTPIEPVVIEKVSRVASDKVSEAVAQAEASVEKGNAELKRRNDAKKAIEDAARQRVADAAKALGTPDEQFTKAMDWLKAKGVDVSAGTKSPSGVWSLETKAGDGAIPVPTDTIKAHYSGWLANGSKFQSSLDTGEPLVYPLNQLVPGWVEGFGSMKAGSKRWLVIPASMAYGEQGWPPVIPGNATLIFEVELLEVVGK